MRIGYISTYPPIECGIATYTYYLVQSLRKTPNEMHIVSQYGAEGKHVYPVYDSDDIGIAKKIFDMMVKITPDVIHIQHEFGLYGEMAGIAILELIYRFKSTATPVIATFHTVNPDEPSYCKRLIIEVMCRELNGIIVHKDEHVRILKSVYHADPAKIYLIPHGAREMKPIKGAKQKLNLEKKKVILLAGYFRPTKGLERIIDVFPQIVKKVPDAWLVISGKIRKLEFSEYRKMLFSKINSSPVKDRIEVFRGQFPQKTFDTIINAADIMVFPYTTGAQSGVVAHALTFGKPIVTSSLSSFKNIVEGSGAGFWVKNAREYVDKIAVLLTDVDVYNTCSKNALKYVKEKISWDIVAKETLEIYKKLEPRPEGKTRYIYVG